MCEIFPEVDSCMGLASIRVGMMLIAVLSMGHCYLMRQSHDSGRLWPFKRPLSDFYQFFEALLEYDKPSTRVHDRTTTGAVVLGVVEQRTNICFDNVMNVYGNLSNVTEPMQVVPYVRSLLSITMVFMSFIFMFAGMTLLFSTLSDQEGFAQMFVWLVFLNIIIGFIMVLSIAFQCTYMDFCLLGNMDWLSSAVTLLAFVGYLILWYYFCCVANSYVLEPHV